MGVRFGMGAKWEDTRQQQRQMSNVKGQRLKRYAAKRKEGGMKILYKYPMPPSLSYGGTPFKAFDF